MAVIIIVRLSCNHAHTMAVRPAFLTIGPRDTVEHNKAHDHVIESIGDDAQTGKPVFVRRSIEDALLVLKRRYPSADVGGVEILSEQIVTI